MVSRYLYGFTPGSYPPPLPQKAEPAFDSFVRVVGGARLLYVRSGSHVRVFDDGKQLDLSPEVEARMIERWPRRG